MKEEIRKIVIPNLTEYLRISQKRAVKPFSNKSKTKLPKKYQTEDFRWNTKGYLIDKNGLIVPSNPKVAGTPRDWRINGQDIYNQKIKHSSRASIMSKLHDMFDPIIKKFEPISEDQYPLTLKVEFYTIDHNKAQSNERNIDNDNKWIYEKVIQDSLTAMKIITDDNPYVINENIKKTIFVEDRRQEKVEITIYGRK